MKLGDLFYGGLMIFKIQYPKLFSLLLIIILFSGCTEDNSDQTSKKLQLLAQESLSQLDGEIYLQGLIDSVEVIRDKYGIPHLYAQNIDDLFFAQGFVMAQDRLWQMEMWRRWRSGRLSEIFGPEAFEYDKRTRLMMYRGPYDEREWESYHPEGKRIFSAYAKGINAYISKNKNNLPVEFKLTGLKPGRWSAKTIVKRWTGLNFPSANNDAIDEIRLALSVKKHGTEHANQMVSPLPWVDLIIPEKTDISIISNDILKQMLSGEGDPLIPGVLPQLEFVEPYKELANPNRHAEAPTPEQLLEIGSNNWAVSGARSITGKVMVANDPHRRLENPSLRYYIHLNAPGWNIIGASEPPFIGVNAGHNERVAWGFTFAGVDVNDVYVEQMHPEIDHLVQWNDTWEPLKIIKEEIPIKGEASRPVVLKYTRHGPVFYEDYKNRVFYSVRSITHEPGTAPYLGCFRMANAESAEDFFERAMFWKVPTHNLVFGDVEGNIAFQVSALTPKRNNWDGRLPVSGNGTYEWDGFRTDLPKEYNPERGWVGSANNDSHPPEFTGKPVMFHSGIGVESSRIVRMRQLLNSRRKLSIRDHKKIQLDSYSLRAEIDIPLFEGWTSKDKVVEKARNLLDRWNLVLDRDSIAAAIYYRWRTQPKPFDLKLSPVQHQKYLEDSLRKTVTQLTQELGPDWSQWRYGRLQKSSFTHMLTDAYSLPAAERSGGFGTIAATSVSFRHILDTSDWDKSVFIITPGQSGQPGSPYYGNLLKSWANDDYLPLSFSKESIKTIKGNQLIIKPLKTLTKEGN
tara:strand:- start:27289 stop:29676 length:2388 start_codon:yes stop_codon:yes gene_type:complete